MLPFVVPENRRLRCAGAELSSNRVRKAFSLVEIVLALGIISFALVGIMGLFPVAMKSAQESQRETRAAQIAQQVFNDLRGTPATNALLAMDTDLTAAQLRLNFSNSSSNVIFYSQEGRVLGTNATGDAIYRVEVVVAPNDPMNGLSRVQTRLSIPANAPSASQSHYSFVTLMNQAK